jgi:hypothetical protein
MGLQAVIQFAFKDAAVAATRESFAGRLFAEGIAHVTGGNFSHVELWLSGPLNAAYCFSSREPAGTQFTTLDLTDTSLWTIVAAPAALLYEQVLFWCKGREGRRYNFLGLDGIAIGTPITDPHDDFCSQCQFELLQDCLGIWQGSRSYWIAPSGFGRDGKRFGFYELLTGDQTIGGYKP